MATPSPARCARCGEILAPAETPCCPAIPSAAGRTGPAAGFGQGFLALFRGLHFVGAHPRLWGWILVPLLINLVLLVVLVMAAWSLGADIAPQWSEPWWSWVDWARAPLRWTVETLAQLMAALAGMVLAVAVSGAVNAPFYDFLSERAEAAHLDRPVPDRPWSLFFVDMLHALRAAVLLLLLQAAVMLPLFVLSFTAVGAPIFVVAAAFFTGLSLTDVTLARKRHTATERARWGRRHWTRLTGLGLPVYFVPPLAPFAIVGATLLYLDTPDKPRRGLAPYLT